ncbi:MAG: hypothetical protein LBC14_08095 [Desulfovibrio sp.]|nr:hypothetical protein [Desulfovibrio sp.]
MAVNALSLAVCLRPWRGAGIYALLRGGEECGQRTVAFDPDVARAYVETPGLNRQDDAFPDPEAAPVFRETSVFKRQDDTLHDPAAAPVFRDDLSDAFPSDDRLSSITQFSAPWRALLEKTRSAPLVWTYEELAGDLRGNASPERSRCLKTLIAALALPRGSSAFWPLSLPASAAGRGTGEAPRAAADVPESAASDRAGMSEPALGNGTGVPEHTGICPEFAAGVRLLGAGAVMYFGTGAVLRSGFALTIRAPYTQQIVAGLQHILLPALSALAEDRENTEKAVAYLRSVLTDHPLLRVRATKNSAR